MIRSRAGLALALALVVGVGTTANSIAADQFTIGYLQLKKDPRYSRKRVYARFLGQAHGRPYSGAKVALSEVKFHGAAIGAQFAIERVRVASPGDMVKATAELRAKGIKFFIIDAPAPVVSDIAAQTANEEMLLLNISARDDTLRQEACQKHLLHIIPSHAMLNDALAQFLLSRKWNRVLVLVGPKPADQLVAKSFTRSAKRFGLKIADERGFALGTDPRAREKNNTVLLTSREKYDVVYVADTDGEFARGLPYRTQRARPIVGSEGLAALAWHWAWERFGAPQLEGRFEKAARRPMQDIDWSAWLAVKAIATAVQGTGSADFDTIRNYLLGDAIVVDGFKGYRLNFRPWNRQLRQPILLGTHNWVIDRAPIEGFLHQTNQLDTLGFDQTDSTCRE